MKIRNLKMLKLYQKSFNLYNVSFIRHLSNYSTKPMPKNKEEENYEKQLKEFERMSNIQKKIKIKQPTKPPFVKNLFLGILDTDILTYPELTNEELNALNKNVKQVETFIQNSNIAEENKISREVWKKMSSGGLLGLQASQLMGGKEATATELCRYFEVLNDLNLKNVIINNETLGVQILSQYANDNLKRKYLQKLIDGECISAFCIVDAVSKLGALKLAAEKSGKNWILNGHKKLVVNGSNADIFIVVAATDCIAKDEFVEKKYTVFVVERDFGGVTTINHNTIHESVQLSDVTFENTPIPDENIVGEIKKGQDILTAVYPIYRLSSGVICASLLKKLIKNTTEHFIALSKGPAFLYDTDAVRIKLGEYLTSLYAIESMTYLTSLLMDNYENQDTELESTIVKVFASEQALQTTTSCLDLLGAEAIVDSHWCNELHKEALCQVVANDNNSNLKILIALFGLRHSGQSLNELVKKLRNPFFHTPFIFKRMWTHRGQEKDTPNLNLFLHHYLHPSCLIAAQRLEYCVLRLQYAVEVFFTSYGAEIIQKHEDLTRLAESVSDIYAMVAVLGRASRSYCIGLPHGDYEIMLATSFVMNATKKVQSRLKAVIQGPFLTTDENFKQVSKRLLELKNYYPVNPISRNF